MFAGDLPGTSCSRSTGDCSTSDAPTIVSAMAQHDRHRLPALGILFLIATAARGADDILIADFEGADYGAWKVQGDAFGSAPAQGTLPNQQHVSGFIGKGLVNTYLRGDQIRGILTSPPIKLERKYVNF